MCMHMRVFNESLLSVNAYSGWVLRPLRRANTNSTSSSSSSSFSSSSSSSVSNEGPATEVTYLFHADLAHNLPDSEVLAPSSSSSSSVSCSSLSSSSSSSALAALSGSGSSASASAPSQSSSSTTATASTPIETSAPTWLSNLLACRIVIHTFRCLKQATMPSTFSSSSNSASSPVRRPTAHANALTPHRSAGPTSPSMRSPNLRRSPHMGKAAPGDVSAKAHQIVSLLF